LETNFAAEFAHGKQNASIGPHQFFLVIIHPLLDNSELLLVTYWEEPLAYVV